MTVSINASDKLMAIFFFRNQICENKCIYIDYSLRIIVNQIDITYVQDNSLNHCLFFRVCLEFYGKRCQRYNVQCTNNVL